MRRRECITERRQADVIHHVSQTGQVLASLRMTSSLPGSIRPARSWIKFWTKFCSANLLMEEPENPAACISLFLGNPRGGRTTAILASLTGTCRGHDIDPEPCLTQVPFNLPNAIIIQLQAWLPGQWKQRMTEPLARI